MHHREELVDAARHGHGSQYWCHTSAQVAPSAIVFPGAYIGPNVIVGGDCVVGPNASIGGPGFGYSPDEGRWIYRQHCAGVVLEDDVHVGASACIDQGRHRATWVKQGARIDNLVHIAHNVIVGRDAIVIAHAMLAGTVEVGDGGYVAPGALVRDHLTVGSGALVGVGAVVIHDIPDGETWAGNPARPLRKGAPLVNVASPTPQ